jgi:hypothetical protein
MVASSARSDRATSDQSAVLCGPPEDRAEEPSGTEEQDMTGMVHELSTEPISTNTSDVGSRS